MRELIEILSDVKNGIISVDAAKKEILNYGVYLTRGSKVCDCPNCGTEIIFGLSKDTYNKIKNSKLFKK